MKKTVVVGMSGGVDSAVAAALLKERGFNVIGLFMHNWEESDSGGVCTSEADWNDALAVSGTLGIPCYSVNFADQYMHRVFEYFLDEYKKGRTPNPDVLCNREIKFGPFKQFAEKLGADYVATGHYCGVGRISREGGIVEDFVDSSAQADTCGTIDGLRGSCAGFEDAAHTDSATVLLKAADSDKDQTYFLNQVKTRQLDNVIFPLFSLKKSEVRRVAERYGFINAKKKDSTGICFIGERKFKQFLSQFLPAQGGEIRDTLGNLVGRHEGLMYYTLGQRRGLGIGGVKNETGRWYVVDKDLAANILTVSCGEGEELLSSALKASGFNWIGTPIPKQFECFAKTRYRQPEQKVFVRQENGFVFLDFEQKQRAVTPGQYAVLYQGERCLGGGVIEETFK